MSGLDDLIKGVAGGAGAAASGISSGASPAAAAPAGRSATSSAGSQGAASRRERRRGMGGLLGALLPVARGNARGRRPPESPLRLPGERALGAGGFLGRHRARTSRSAAPTSARSSATRSSRRSPPARCLRGRGCGRRRAGAPRGRRQGFPGRATRTRERARRGVRELARATRARHPGRAVADDASSAGRRSRECVRGRRRPNSRLFGTETKQRAAQHVPTTRGFILKRGSYSRNSPRATVTACPPTSTRSIRPSPPSARA